MKKILYVLMAGLSVGLLTGCGGSIADKVKESFIKKRIEGIYNISTLNDIMYFTVERAGRVNTYLLNNDENCYNKNLSDGLNSQINGRIVEIDYKNEVFKIDSTSWYYGSEKKILEVRSNNLKSNDILETNNIRIATSKYLTKNITMGELNQSLCN